MALPTLGCIKWELRYRAPSTHEQQGATFGCWSMQLAFEENKLIGADMDCPENQALSRSLIGNSTHCEADYQNVCRKHA